MDLDISKKVEEEQKKEKKVPVEDIPPVEEKPHSHDVRNLFVFLGVLAVLFVAVYFGVIYYKGITTAAVLNVDELHQKNLAGDLGEKEGYIYNGYSFVKADGLWWTEMNKFGTTLKVPLHFGPREVEKIPIGGKLDAAFNSEENMYIAIDPEVMDKYYTLALSELSFNVVKGLDRRPVGSCTKGNWACDNRTIVSCANNTLGKPVIELALQNETGIELSGSCVKISGKEYDLVKAVDRVLYQWYGIIK